MKLTAASINPNQNPSPADSTSQSRIDFLWKVHSYTNDYIRFADSKAAIVAGAVSTLIGALIASGIFDHLLTYSWRGRPSPVYFGMISLGFLFSALMCAVASIRPRLTSDVPKGFIFWDSIVEHNNEKAYCGAFAKLTPEDLERNVSRHVYTLARICKRKYFWSSLSIVLGTIGGLIAGIILLSIHLAA